MRSSARVQPGPSKRAGARASLLRRAALFALPVALVAGCNTPTPSPSQNIPRGGTLRVIVPAADNAGSDLSELARCCLARTLMNYPGEPTRFGGADLHPDLADGPPVVSADGLTWTFHIRPGLHYAPPEQGVEITAADFVRAFQRECAVGGGFFPDLDGCNAYALRHTQSIAGLQTPDAHTLVVHLTAAHGDLASRLALPTVSPLPPLPGDPTAPYGVATGHDAESTGFTVSSGPYMIQGADRVNFSLPPAQQQPASGFVAGKSITLVRNPSWRAADDLLRPAYVDRIVISYGGTIDDAVAAVSAGRADIIISEAHAPQIPLATIRAYAGRVDVEPRDGVRFISLNLATPPFDDLHVRRAVAFVLDRKGIEDKFGGAVSGAVTGHIALDSMEDNALFNYDPYRTPDPATALRMARQEMALSSYDSHHSGVCDAAACEHIAVLALSDRQTSSEMAGIVRQNLLQIGLHLDVTLQPNPETLIAHAADPTQDPAMILFLSWFKDYPNGSDFFVNLFSNTQLPGGDISLLGATPEQLRGWGYSVSTVPGVDDRIDACMPLVGQPQVRCWTTLDEYMTEKVVPVIPFATESYAELVPARIAHYSYDQSNDLPAFDQIAVSGQIPQPTTTSSAATTPPTVSPSPSGTPPPGGPAPSELIGTWIEVSPTAGLDLTLSAAHYAFGEGHGDIVVNGNEIDFFNGDSCGLPLPQGVGRYRWKLSGTTLTFTGITVDPCGRVNRLDGATYMKG
jgi:ABC-type transport system substrate-binding protein